MRSIPFVRWIAHAAACLTGPHGAVTEQARQSGCSRQAASDHAQEVLAAVEAQHSGGPAPDPLIQQDEALRRENRQLWDWIDQAVAFPKTKQHQFAVTAAAMGLSLNQIRSLLALILGASARPGRSTIDHWLQAAEHVAGRVLKVLDQRCRALILVGCLDEIFFHRRPVLVAVEPASMTWFLGQKGGDCTGATWAQALQPFDALQFVTADAGSGLQAGIAAVQQQRQEQGQTPLVGSLDVFHTRQEEQRVLGQSWKRVERLWEQAEAADRKVQQQRRQGQDGRRVAWVARRAWQRVEEAFRQYDRAAAGCGHARAALAVFGPDGRLNDRTWATAQIAAAVELLAGPEWAKLRRLLQADAALNFLDRLHDQLRQAVADEVVRAALVRLWWLRRQRPGAGRVGAVVGSGHVAHLVQQQVCQGLCGGWRELYQAVARVLRGVVRASSAVECLNSVLRMHQARHRTVEQGLLDLKRLYWNCQEFLEGKRRARSPYHLLGLKLPSYRFWDVLGMESPPAAAV